MNFDEYKKKSQGIKLTEKDKPSKFKPRRKLPTRRQTMFNPNAKRVSFEDLKRAREVRKELNND